MDDDNDDNTPVDAFVVLPLTELLNRCDGILLLVPVAVVLLFTLYRVCDDNDVVDGTVLLLVVVLVFVNDGIGVVVVVFGIWVVVVVVGTGGGGGGTVVVLVVDGVVIFVFDA